MYLSARVYTALCHKRNQPYFTIRRGSGGVEQQRGSDGVIREVGLLTAAQVTLLSDRRQIAPYGLAGGEAGEVGEAALISSGRTEGLAGKFSIMAKAGDRIVTYIAL